MPKAPEPQSDADRVAPRRARRAFTGRAPWAALAIWGAVFGFALFNLLTR